MRIVHIIGMCTHSQPQNAHQRTNQCHRCSGYKIAQLPLLPCPICCAVLLIVMQGVQQLGAGLVSIRRIELRTLLDDSLQARGQLRVPMANRIYLIGRLTGILPGDQMVERHAQAIHIRSGICLAFSTELFRRSVSFRAQAHRVGQALVFVLPGDAKVDHLYISVGLQHNISRLHIPVNNGRLSGVQVFQRLAYLHCPFNDQFLRLCAVVLQDRAEGLSLDIVLDYVDHISVVDNIYNADNGRMIQLLY